MNGLGPAWGPAHSITQRLTSTSASPEASSGRPTGTREVRERVGFCRSPGGRAGRWPRPRETARERRSGRPRRAVLDQSSPLDGVGHKNLDRTRDQVFPRVRSTCSASAVTVGIQTVHRARHLFSQHCRAAPEPMSHPRMGGMHRHIMGGTAGQSAWVGNFPAGCSIAKPPRVARCSKLVLGFRAGLNRPRRKPAGHAADRNKCTLQPRTRLGGVRRALQRASPPSSARIAVSDEQGGKTTTRRTGPRLDLPTPDPRWAHQRVRTRCVTTAFSCPTGQVYGPEVFGLDIRPLKGGGWSGPREARRRDRRARRGCVLVPGAPGRRPEHRRR